MPTVIREFRVRDFDSLWKIDQQCFPPGISYSRAELAAFIRLKSAFTLVAENSEKIESGSPEIRGFIVAKVTRKAQGHIITIDVIASGRRSGVGSILLRSAEEKLHSVGCRSVVLETAVDNIGALNFYKRHGYHVVSTAPRYYSNGVDAFVLQKDLLQATADGAVQ